MRGEQRIGEELLMGVFLLVGFGRDVTDFLPMMTTTTMIFMVIDGGDDYLYFNDLGRID
jgi:hypothetical protein